MTEREIENLINICQRNLLEKRYSAKLFSQELCEDVRHDYLELLSVGIDDDEADRRVKGKYRLVLNKGDINEAEFYFALSYTQWKKGRLSEENREKALFFLENGMGLWPWQRSFDDPYYQKRLPSMINERKKVLKDLEEMLRSPMPPRKKQKIETDYLCPWREGDVIAWKIEHPQLKDKRLFGKYVLIRVVKVRRSHYCRLAPERGFIEDMVYALYKWWGDFIPDPHIVDQLDFQYLFKRNMEESLPAVVYKHADMLKALNPVNNLLDDPAFQRHLNSFLQRKLEYCHAIAMNFKCELKKRKREMICIMHDDGFERKPYFHTGITDIGIGSFDTAEIGISNAFDWYVFSDDGNTEPINANSQNPI